jgi:UDP-2,4-diacetamido-2,4,6-trideoxy-beta-L-altropyranose hydrolase
MSAKSLTLISNGNGAKEIPPREEGFCALGLSSKPFVWIRTTAGPFIGFGHLRRTIVLAQELSNCANPIFIVDPKDVWTREAAQNQGWRTALFEQAEIWSHLPIPAAILADTRDPSGMEALIAEASKRDIPCISIQDLGLNPLPADVVIDGSISPSIADRRRNKKESYTGTSYMVLETSYCFLHRQAKRIREKLQSIVINLGGGDSRRFFPTILEGIMLHGGTLDVIGIPGFTSWGQVDLSKRDWRPMRFRWASIHDSIPKLLYRADLAITAGGLSAFEALCVGTPIMALSYDEFQQHTVSTLTKAKSCVDLGRSDLLKPRYVADLLQVMDENPQERKNLSIRGKKIVDGRGAERVVRIIRRAIESGHRASSFEASL